MCHDIGLEHDGEVPVEWWREPLMSTVCATGGVPPSREYDRGSSKWVFRFAFILSCGGAVILKYQKPYSGI